MNNHNLDDAVDKEIENCLLLSSPKSFFLFAGAGSGKTSSLIKALKFVDKSQGKILNRKKQKVAIITYTNAACDEISSRSEYNPLFQVSTIHSFAWDLIKSYTDDIRDRVKAKLLEDIEGLNQLQSKSRGRNKSFINREKKIDNKQTRLGYLDQIKMFTYNPNGDNQEKDSLNHAEVIDLVSYFLTNKPILQNILVRRFPFLLIDESQDTNKNLIEALFSVQQKHSKHFATGLIGDMMQRIYLDGKKNLGEEEILSTWHTPEKKLNHRCPARVVALINKIREIGDGKQQVPRTDAKSGTVRLFIVKSDCENKFDQENAIRDQMGGITDDKKWEDPINVQTLTLEHHMASKRMGFDNFFIPLYDVNKLKTGVLDGTNSDVRVFRSMLLDLYRAKTKDDQFAVTRILKKYSPLFSLDIVKTSKKKKDQINLVKKATQNLFKLWDEGNDPTLLELLKNINTSRILPLSRTLSIIAKRTKGELEIISETEDEAQEEDGHTDIINAWDEALKAKFSDIIKYDRYISGEANFGTHQGVKGREFPRVMVILDDFDAKGNLFNYEKMFGVKKLSDRDIKNMEADEETGFDRTLRLFYVTCSRAKESLAIVAYTDDPETLKANVMRNGWFKKEEIL